VGRRSGRKEEKGDQGVIDLVIGGQFGSEGKGSVVSWLSKSQDRPFDVSIRTGSPNAGHTFRAGEGLVKMRQLPCSWHGQKDNVLYVPAGAVINEEVFCAEVEMVYSRGFTGRILVSPQAAVISEEAGEVEKGLQHGTTGEGVGYTRAEKCMRHATLAKDCDRLVPFVPSRSDWLYQALAKDSYHLLVESTQGFGLSMDYFQYPFCTSTNLTPYRILDDAEIPWGAHKVNVWMVLRTFPIRIAGNSGSLWLETSWDELRKKYGSHIPVERTTVTDKVRRVGEFDVLLALDAIHRCRPNNVVLTFFDYLYPNVKETGLTQQMKQVLSDLSLKIEHRITHVGVGIGEVLEV
jgi:adenylosuccinate synthase